MYEEIPVKKKKKMMRCLIRPRERFGNAKVRFLLPPFLQIFLVFLPIIRLRGCSSLNWVSFSWQRKIRIASKIWYNRVELNLCASHHHLRIQFLKYIYPRTSRINIFRLWVHYLNGQTVLFLSVTRNRYRKENCRNDTPFLIIIRWNAGVNRHLVLLTSMEITGNLTRRILSTS